MLYRWLCAFGAIHSQINCSIFILWNRSIITIIIIIDIEITISFTLHLILIIRSIKGLRHSIFKFDIFNALNHLVILKHEKRSYVLYSLPIECVIEHRTELIENWTLNWLLSDSAPFNLIRYHISKFAIQFPWWKESDFTFRKINSISLCVSFSLSVLLLRCKCIVTIIRYVLSVMLSTSHCSALKLGKTCGERRI